MRMTGLVFATVVVRQLQLSSANEGQNSNEERGVLIAALLLAACLVGTFTMVCCNMFGTTRHKCINKEHKQAGGGECSAIRSIS